MKCSDSGRIYGSLFFARVEQSDSLGKQFLRDPETAHCRVSRFRFRLAGRIPQARQFTVSRKLLLASPGHEANASAATSPCARRREVLSNQLINHSSVPACVKSSQSDEYGERTYFDERARQVQKVARDAQVNEVLDVLVVPQTPLFNRMFVCCSCVHDE